MEVSIFLDKVQILYGPNRSVEKDSVLILNGKIEAFGAKARTKAKEHNLKANNVSEQLLAPPLVDPHSILPNPIKGRAEDLKSLKNAASNAGYGQIALLPRSKNSRDTPEKLWGFSNNSGDIIIHLWANFSQGGKEENLSSHGDLIQGGAIGLADDDSIINISLLQKGLVLGEMANHPILLAPREKKIQGNGIVREGVETLRAGWEPDPKTSEILPLRQIIELKKQFPDKAIKIMNLSTKESVLILKSSKFRQSASVTWWHLISDRTKLAPTDIGWTVTPSLGGKEDRHALIEGIKDESIMAISVHSIPLEEEEIQLPPDRRIPGLSGHQLVLPSLWQELVVKNNLSIEKLWSALSFGPSRMINSQEETLEVGSRRWLLFDPNHSWIQSRYDSGTPKAANQPWEGEKILGKVILCGLKA